MTLCQRQNKKWLHSPESNLWFEQKAELHEFISMLHLCFCAQGVILPQSLALQGLLLVTPCQVTVSSSLRADGHGLTVELSQSCRPPHLSGTLTHSFPGLKSLGVPQIVTMEATAPEGPEEAGALLLQVGTCTIRARKVIETRGVPQGLWALESTCPELQVGFM